MILASGMDITGLAGLIAVIVTVIAALAGAAGFARASFAKAQIEALREARDDLNDRVDFLDAENTRVKADLKAEVAQRVALEKVVTGSKELEQILGLLAEHDKRAQRLEDAVNRMFTLTVETNTHAHPGDKQA